MSHEINVAVHGGEMETSSSMKSTLAKWFTPNVDRADEMSWDHKHDPDYFEDYNRPTDKEIFRYREERNGLFISNGKPDCGETNGAPPFILKDVIPLDVWNAFVKARESLNNNLKILLIVGGVLSFIGILVLIVANPVIGILVLIVAGLDLFIMKCYEENTTLDILSVINRSTQSKGCTFLPLWKMFEGLSTDGDNAARKVVGFVVIADLSHDDIKTNDKIMNWHPSHGLKTDQRQVTDNSQLQSTIIPVNSANPTQSALPAYPSAPPAYPSVSAPLLTCNVWTEEYDAENKHKYWFNATTAQSSWIKPEGPGVIIRNKDTETGRESLPPSEAPLKYPSGF